MEKLFAVYDNVAKCTLVIGNAKNHQTFIRSNVRVFASQYPLKDLDIYQIGSIDMETFEITTEPRKKIEWNDYNYPETKSEAVSPLIAKTNIQEDKNNGSN